MNKSKHEKEATLLFQKGVTQAKAGQKERARNYIHQALALDPENEAAWLYLAAIAKDKADAVEALTQTQTLNPNNPHLKKAWAWLTKTWPDDAPPYNGNNDTPKQIDSPQTPLPLPKKEETTVENVEKPQAETPVKSPLLAQIARGNMIKIGAVAMVLVVIIIVLSIALNTIIFNDVPTTLAANIVVTPTDTTATRITRLKQELEQAKANAEQPTSIAILEEMHQLTPDDKAIITELADLYYQRGLILRNGGNFEEAKISFGQAQGIAPDLGVARAEYRLADLYLSGVKYHQRAQWEEAVFAFSEIYRQVPNYPFVDEILYSAYFNLGIVKSNQGHLQEAQQAFLQANAILPEALEAQRKLLEIDMQLNPPTPTPMPTPTNPPAFISYPQTEKRIVVDISEQRTYAYEGDTLVYTFIVSTGEPGRDTAVGEFEILNKLPTAYASTWNLDMPYWLGIYWSGPLQNGFHALPTVRHTGQVMWDGFLGQRVSYGCVILSQSDAHLLYNWVDIGTPVKIQW